MKTTQAQREAAARWRKKHPDRARAAAQRAAARIKASPDLLERRRAAYRRYYASNRSVCLAANRAYRATPQGRIADRLRGKLRAALKWGLSSSIEGLLGCTLPAFRRHIESQFSPSMQWGNYGTEWELDHIQPCRDFDLTRPEEQARCFRYQNLRPLARSANRIKWSNNT